MCYPSNREFRWDTKKDAVREPEGRRETIPEAGTEPRVEAKDFKFWAFPRRRREHTATEPVADRTREKV